MTVTDPAAGRQLKYVCFYIDGQLYGIPVHQVCEVLPVPEITPVIHTPAYIRGVINLRGEILCTIDTRLLFGLAPARLTGQSKIIVIVSETAAAGLLVDRVAPIYSGAAADHESLPVTVTGKLAEFLSGITTMAATPLMVVNVDNIFNSRELKMFRETA